MTGVQTCALPIYALISKRVYKAAYEPDKAYQMIINGHSGAFSPKLLKAFTEVKADFEHLLDMYHDEKVK